MTLIIIIAVIAILVIATIALYNGLVGSRNQVKEAFSTMDVYLVKRHDLIPNLVETVKGYMTHEAGTLEKVTSLRNTLVNETDIPRQIEGEQQLSQALRSIQIAVENYPDLKANQSFLNLQNQLQKIEEDIANSRKYYNGSVRNYNNNLEKFPSNIVASLFKFAAYPFFEAATEERENVAVKF